ncbi:hypothetical protein GYMLUDRAFT_65155 [Collybiopsis luxurians FD-317 M1]|uniref:Uncharacterized protein n=1 Tax=Collybiopsis luxurians FD-317 M1 TaxID=944289 RepID=A0A0D0B962_9AGAR|nr:hypothetical protein GYMLUDRAFT_65155 [Collybiopsis luxurians FD-317 M1]
MAKDKIPFHSSKAPLEPYKGISPCIHGFYMILPCKIIKYLFSNTEKNGQDILQVLACDGKCITVCISSLNFKVQLEQTEHGRLDISVAISSLVTSLSRCLINGAAMKVVFSLQHKLEIWETNLPWEDEIFNVNGQQCACLVAEFNKLPDNL